MGYHSTLARLIQALLFGVYKYQFVLYSLRFLGFLFVVGSTFFCWVWKLATSINWAGLSFHFGLLLGFFGGSLISGALFTPAFAFCFVILLCIQSCTWLDVDLAVGALGSVTSSVSVRVHVVMQDVFPAHSLRLAPSIMHVSGTSGPRVPALTTSRPSYLSYAMVCRLIIPYLDSYEVVLSTRGFHQYATDYTTCQPGIMKWYRSYVLRQRFVCDLTDQVVRTSVGNIVYPDLEFRVHRLVSIQPTSKFAVANSTATVYTDIDSVLCTYCDKTRHSAEFCWKRAKDEKLLFKRMGATAANNWGWGWG